MFSAVLTLFERPGFEIIRVKSMGLSGWWRMAGMLSQLPLPVPPAEAVQVADGAAVMPCSRC
jgi:hypothetical protein